MNAASTNFRDRSALLWSPNTQSIKRMRSRNSPWRCTALHYVRSAAAVNNNEMKTNGRAARRLIEVIVRLLFGLKMS